MNQSPTTASGSQAMRRPMPSVATTKSRQSVTQSRPNQKVRICQRKCDSSQVPRASLRLT